jgi:hypothetical protein
MHDDRRVLGPNEFDCFSGLMFGSATLLVIRTFSVNFVCARGVFYDGLELVPKRFVLITFLLALTQRNCNCKL